MAENLKFLKDTQKIAHLGNYILNVQSGYWSSSEILDDIFGIESDFDKSVQGWVSIIHPEWQTIMNDYFANEVIGNKQKFDKEYKIIRQKDKVVRWVHGFGELEFDNDNNPIKMIGLILDITERKQAEEKLFEQRHIYEQILEQSLAGYWDWDIPTGDEYLSPTFKKMFGYEDNEIENKATSWQKLIFAEDLPCVYEKYNQHAESKGKIPFYNEVRYHHKNGSIVWVICTGKVIEWDEDGKAKRMIGCHIDISERKLAEEALRENEARFRAFIEQSPVAIGLFNLNGLGAYANQKFMDILGLKNLEEMIGRPAHEFFVPQFREDSIERTRRRLAGLPVPVEYESICLRSDGTEFPVQMAVAPIQFSDGISSIAFLTDITERKLAEETIRKSEENLSITLHSIGDGVISTDENGLIVQMNPVAETMCGWTLAEAKGKSFAEVFRIINSESREPSVDPVEFVIEKGLTVELANHTVLISKDGTEYQIADSAAPIKNKDGKILGVVLVFSDVTEKYKVQQDLKEREEQYNRLVSTMTQGLALHEIICDEQGVPVDYRFLTANKSFEALTGLKIESIIGKTVLELMPGTEKYWIEQYGKVALTGEPAHFENFAREIGKYYEVLAYSPEKNQFAVVISDITERKRAENALQKQVVALTRPLDDTTQIHFKDLFNLVEIQKIQDSFADATGVASIITYPNGTPITNPSNFCRLCIDVIRKTEIGLKNCFKSDAEIGRRNDSGPNIQPCLSCGLWDAGASITVGGKHIANWLIGQVRNEESDEEKILKYAEEIGADPKEYQEALAEVPIMSKDKFLKISEALFNFANELSLKAYQNVQQARFINESKEAEEVIRQNEFRLKSLIELSNMQSNSLEECYNFILNKSMEITGSDIGFYGFVDEAEENVRIFAWSDSVMKSCAVQNKTIDFVVSQTGLWGEVIRQSKPIIINDYSQDHPKKKGIPEGHVDIKNYASIPFFDNNKIVSILSVGNKPSDYTDNDITQLSLFMEGMWGIVRRRQHLSDLKIAKAKAEESEKLKSAFLANMSHEIRTPMNGIIGFSKLMAEQDLTIEERTEYSNILNSSCTRLLNTVNDVLDISKIDAGQMEVKESTFFVNKVINELNKLHYNLFDFKNVALTYSIDEELESIQINSDEQKIYQILNNLLGNAYKFTHDGRVEYGCNIKDEFIEFYVSDTGIGISDDAKELIFGRFNQENLTLARGHEGSGLGLSISRGLVDLLGGRIWVESEKGVGSTFRFTVPLKISKTENRDISIKHQHHSDDTLSKKLKILVAEDEISNYLLAKNILIRGLNAEVIRAENGLETLEIFNDNADISLIVMDIKMPLMDGLEVTRIIRKMNKDIPIIAVTAFALSGDREKALDAGCDDYISKPFDANNLVLKIQKLLD